MTARAHRRLFLLGTLAWVAFWVLGLPSYYQQYSTAAMVWFVALLLPPLTWLCVHVLRRVAPERRMRLALWMAFYFTVPLAVYDGLYCGVFLEHGFGFLSRYWYLTIYYVIPWLVLPASAALLNRTARDRGRSAGSGGASLSGRIPKA